MGLTEGGRNQVADARQGVVLLRFAGRFLTFFLLCLLVYLAVVPAYRTFVVASSNVLTRAMSPPTRLDIDEAGNLIAYVRDAGADGKQERHLQSWAAFVPHLLFLTLALLPALILALPLSWRDRLWMLGWGLSAMVLIDLVAVAGLVRFTRCLHVTPGAFVCLWLLRMIYASGQLSAAVIWGGLIWRYRRSFAGVAGDPEGAQTA